MNELVLLEKIEEHIALITINRPEVSNALSLDLIEEFKNIILAINNDSSIYCAIITGAGERAFCAGADLKERRGMTDSEVISTVKKIGDLVKSIENINVPVIAAINGAAYGGGLELALGCDIRVITESAKVGLTETSLAIIPGAGGTQRLSRLIGISPAKELIFTALPISAQKALDIGLVNYTVLNENLLDKAIEIARQITKNGPIALKLSKQAINTGIEQSLDEGLQIEHELYKSTLATKDRIEGLEAFKEKRKPVYKGQ